MGSLLLKLLLLLLSLPLALKSTILSPLLLLLLLLLTFTTGNAYKSLAFESDIEKFSYDSLLVIFLFIVLLLLTLFNIGLLSYAVYLYFPFSSKYTVLVFFIGLSVENSSEFIYCKSVKFERFFNVYLPNLAKRLFYILILLLIRK